MDLLVYPQFVSTLLWMLTKGKNIICEKSINDSPLGSNPADFSQGVNLGDSPPWGIPQGFSSFSSNLKLLLLVFKILACCQSPLPFPDSSLRSKMKVVQFQCCITVVRIVMIKVMIMSRGDSSKTTYLTNFIPCWSRIFMCLFSTCFSLFIPISTNQQILHSVIHFL